MLGLFSLLGIGVGLALNALRISERVEGRKAKLPFQLVMIILLLDDVQLILHSIEKWKGEI